MGAASDLFADSADHLVHPADFLRALRDWNARLEALWPISIARNDRLGRYDQARAGDNALVDRLADTEVRVTRAFGSEVALRREAGHQSPFGMNHGACRPHRQRFVQHL